MLTITLLLYLLLFILIIWRDINSIRIIFPILVIFIILSFATKED
jgi:hypothetical protein